MLKRFQFLSAIVLFTFLWITIRFPYQVKETIGRFVSDKNRVDPASLHLHGEFVETNLGTAQEHDGSVTVRMIAQRYVFVPQCMLLPAGVSVHFRITSSGVTHELTASGTDFHIKVVPGAVTEAHMRFTRTGETRLQHDKADLHGEDQEGCNEHPDGVHSVDGWHVGSRICA